MVNSPRPPVYRPGPLVRTLPYLQMVSLTMNIIDKTIKVVLGDGSHRTHSVSDSDLNHYHAGGALHIHDGSDCHCFTLKK